MVPFGGFVFCCHFEGVRGWGDSWIDHSVNVVIKQMTMAFFSRNKDCQVCE